MGTEGEEGWGETVGSESKILALESSVTLTREVNNCSCNKQSRAAAGDDGRPRRDNS